MTDRRAGAANPQQGGFMYYISWSPSYGCRCTRCFSSESERDAFWRHVEGIKGAGIRTWEYFPD